jgi:hypothetical protein
MSEAGYEHRTQGLTYALAGANQPCHLLRLTPQIYAMLSGIHLVSISTLLAWRCGAERSMLGKPANTRVSTEQLLKNNQTQQTWHECRP